MWEEKEFIDPFNTSEKYFWMKVEQLGRYLFAKDEVNKTNYLSPRVCDVGCANGYGARVISKVAGEVIGLDVNEEYLAVAKKSANPNQSYMAVNFENVCPNLGTFDYITAFEFIEHLSNPAKPMQFFKESLSAGGELILSIPNPEFESTKDGVICNHYHKRLYSDSQIEELLSDYGFEIEKRLYQPYPNLFSKQEAKFSKKGRLPLNSADDEMFKDDKVITYFAYLLGYPIDEQKDKSYSFIYVTKKRVD